jgi:hypothetical protein
MMNYTCSVQWLHLYSTSRQTARVKFSRRLTSCVTVCVCVCVCVWRISVIEIICSNALEIVGKFKKVTLEFKRGERRGVQINVPILE